MTVPARLGMMEGCSLGCLARGDHFMKRSRLGCVCRRGACATFKRRLTHVVLFRIMGTRPWFTRCRDL